MHPNPEVNEFGETAHTEPSQGDGSFARKFAKDTGVAGENYVIAADGKVYVFNEAGFEVVGSRLSLSANDAAALDPSGHMEKL